MIRVEMSEQAAVELDGTLTTMRDVFRERGLDDLALRDAQLAVKGALRAAGWTPVPNGWERRPRRTSGRYETDGGRS